jgi:hypothetical protein
MKKILLTSFAIVALMSSCKKTETTTPTPIAVAPTPTSNLKTVMVVINKGGLDQFTNIRWSYTPSIDSSYNSYNNGYVRTYINTTESDSLFIYSSSRPLGGGMQMSDQITIYVNGVFKQSYSGIADFRKVYIR